MSLLEKLRPKPAPTAVAPIRPTAETQSPDDWALVRMTMQRGMTVTGPGGKGILSDGDEMLMPQEDAHYFVTGNLAVLLGFLPKPAPTEKAIDGPARTIRFDLETRRPSAHLGRPPFTGETVTLPAAEALGYVRDGVARFDHASARVELETHLAAILPGVAPDAVRRVVSAIDDLLRTSGVYAPLDEAENVRG